MIIGKHMPIHRTHVLSIYMTNNYSDATEKVKEYLKTKTMKQIKMLPEFTDYLPPLYPSIDVQK